MEKQLTKIWEEYEKGKNFLQKKDIYSRSERCHEFVDGDQWSGLNVPKGVERPAQLNILAPIMKSSTALVGQNTMDIIFSPLNKTYANEKYVAMCEALNKFVKDTWERLKLDAGIWDILEDSFIAGDALAYFYWQDEEIKIEYLDNTNIIFADENNPHIQKQPYILIPQRKYLQDVKQEAAANGLAMEDIEGIVADESEETAWGEEEKKNEDKVTVITKLWKSQGTVHIARAARTVQYQPDTVLQGENNGIVSALSLYPVVKYSWKLRKNSARGVGDIWDKIPNQISINKNFYRFETSVKSGAFPHKIYSSNALSASEVDKLNYPGSSIAVTAGVGQQLDGLIRYLQPGNISPYAISIWQDLIKLTRELSGAGDNLENINPEQASGAAINAAREAKTLNVNAQVAAFKQFVEDIALVWANLWQVYNKDVVAFEDVTIDPTEFIKLKPSVRVDVSPNSPYSKMAQELNLKELFLADKISFEEYVSALDDSSNVPKAKLLDIVAKRQALQEQMAQEQLLMEQQAVGGMPQIIDGGGDENAMQEMQYGAV
ncbi:MAG: hypothetical protein RR827_03710 [Oscillospiraceae bacterium]